MGDPLPCYFCGGRPGLDPCAVCGGVRAPAPIAELAAICDRSAAGAPPADTIRELFAVPNRFFSGTAPDGHTGQRPVPIAPASADDGLVVRQDSLVDCHCCGGVGSIIGPDLERCTCSYCDGSGRIHPSRRLGSPDV